MFVEVQLVGVKYVGCVWVEGLWWEDDENGASIFASCRCGCGGEVRCCVMR